MKREDLDRKRVSWRARGGLTLVFNGLAAFGLSTFVIATRADTAELLSLYHPFQVTADARWSRVTVKMTASEWHVGRPDGPSATPAELQRVLDRLRILVVGCDCVGANAGSTHYPCAFEMTHPMADRTLVEVGAVQASWHATVGYTLTRFDTRTFRATSLPASPSRLSSSLPASVVLDAGFLGLMAPQEFLQRAAAARVISFDVRARSNKLGRAEIKRESGAIVISTEPSTGVSSLLAPTEN